MRQRYKEKENHHLCHHIEELQTVNGCRRKSSQKSSKSWFRNINQKSKCGNKKDNFQMGKIIHYKFQWDSFEMGISLFTLLFHLHIL